MSDISQVRAFLAYGRYLSLQFRLYDGRGKAVAAWNIDSRYPLSEEYKRVCRDPVIQESNGSSWVEYEVVPVIVDILATARRLELTLPNDVTREMKYLVECVSGYEYQVELLGALFSLLRVTPG